MLRAHTLLAAALAAAFALAANAGAQNRTRVQERTQERSRIDTTFAFPATGTVSLELIAGDIRVTAWTRNEARVVAVSERGVIRALITSNTIELDARPRGGNMGQTRYDITVPIGVAVTASTVAGSINVAGTRGAVFLETVAGSIDASDVQGRAEIESTAGRITLQRADGKVGIETIGGPIMVTEIKGDLDVSTVGGSVRIDRADLANLNYEAVAGTFDFGGTLAAQGRHSISSHAGAITLRLPDNFGASLEVETWSGQFQSPDFQPTMQPGAGGGRGRNNQRRLFTINGGGARLNITTHSGDVVLRKLVASSRREY